VTRSPCFAVLRAAVIAVLAASACQPSPAHRRELPAAPGGPAMAGFTDAAAARERGLERRFLAGVSPDRVSAFHRYLTAEPHRATSPRNTALAHWIAEQWRAQGWEHVALRTYEALFSEPEHVSLEVVAPVRYRATLREGPYDVDPSTRDPAIGPSFSAFSASGDVTAEVVYAHGGDPEDYDVLRAHGIRVTGKIVLVRYSYPYSFRGFKVMTAEREGASAIVLYSDPAEDGPSRGKTFPDGPWGPESHVQRGIVSYASIVPGDPTTPGWASVPGARHLEPSEASALPKIAALAISARDARPLLEHMTGEQVPAAWRGGLPITYRFTGAVTARVRVAMRNSLRTYTNVEARLTGREHPEQWVSLGNHRDAWVYGGADASSGTASLLELTRGLGALARTGWRPRRTIVVCSWDGEEEGMIGSTEWAEQHAEALERNLVAHINVDTAIRGVLNLFTGEPDPNFEALAVPSLSPMIVEASRDVPAPNGKTLYDAWRRTRTLEFAAPAELTDANIVLSRIDPSSDHTVFLHHLTRPVIAMTYAGQYGVYHSVYDDRYYMEHFGDPGFHYSANIAQLWGVLAMRLSDAELLPFDFAPYADVIRDALDALDALARTAGATQLDFAVAQASVRAFRAAAVAFNAATARVLRATSVDAKIAGGINRSAMAVESNWRAERGLPGRPWSRHIIHGMRPTFQPLLLPGITDAIERRDWSTARDQLAVLAAALDRNAALLHSASK
jgi:N-acetylated-alpha-linked acidic dipeptidase